MALRRVVTELQCASTPDLGIYVQDVHVAPSTVLPLHGYAVLVSLQSCVAPCLVRFEYEHTYPFLPLTVRAVSYVPHPLIGDDGSIDVDILNTQWSPALTLRTVLTSLQWALTEPTHPDILRADCLANSTWRAGSVKTAQQHVPLLFSLLLEAALPHSWTWHSWHFIRGLRSLLSMDPLAYQTSRGEWYALLRALASWHHSFRGYSKPEDPSSLEQAQQCWMRESRALLDEHFRLDGLRMLLHARLVEASLGDLQRVSRVWVEIQSFVSDIEISELLGGQPRPTAVCTNELRESTGPIDDHLSERC